MNPSLDVFAWRREVAKNPEAMLIGIEDAMLLTRLSKSKLKQAEAEGRLTWITLTAYGEEIDGGYWLTEVRVLMHEREALAQRVFKVIDAGLKRDGRRVFWYKSQAAEPAGVPFNSHPDRRYFGGLLEDLSMGSWERHRILISSVVVEKSTGMPSNGFFSLVDSLSGARLPNESNDACFWRHCELVYRHYGLLDQAAE